MTRRAVAVCALALLALGGCRSRSEPLELVPNQPAREKKPRPVFRWEASFEVPGAAADQQIVAWVPLPQSSGAQGVRSLLYQLGPKGKLSEERTPAGDRLLRVRTTRAALKTLKISARFEQRALEPKELPAELDGLDRSSPEAWARAARAAGAKVRLAHGVRVDPQGAASACTWPELKRGEEWLAVDLEAGQLQQPRGHLRLATVRPRATLGGKPVPILPRYQLTRIN